MDMKITCSSIPRFLNIFSKNLSVDEMPYGKVNTISDKITHIYLALSWGRVIFLILISVTSKHRKSGGNLFVSMTTILYSGL